MKTALHAACAVLATVLIATFLACTIVAEGLGSDAAVALVKRWIVYPGLLILVPALAVAGGTGFALSRSRRGRLIEAKKKRMPFIAANGLLVLVPCAIVLDLWASAGAFDARFYLVQAVELVAGAINLALMTLNLRDGLRLRSLRLRSLQVQHSAS
jgi:hypothetical protein